MKFENQQLLCATPSELQDIFVSNGYPGFRGKQLFDWIHKKGIINPFKMTNLPESLQKEIQKSGCLNPVSIGNVFTSIDNTRKIEISLQDGNTVETVLIPEGDKLTQCISSQVGCSVGCEFCRSGKFGFVRNLTASEILGQIIFAKEHYLASERLTNIVFMGIGEPLHNYDNVLRAYQIINHPNGMNISNRRITISTAGILKGIEKLGKDTNGKAALAISLHASSEQTRQKLVKGLKASLDDIIKALKNYPLPKRRRITIEYVLVKDVNDSEEDAINLVKCLIGIPVKINLLPLNPHDLCDMVPPSEERIETFQSILTQKGLSVFMRKKRGNDINAACGQLLGIEQKR